MNYVRIGFTNQFSVLDLSTSVLDLSPLFPVPTSFNFGGHPIVPACVFYRSAHCFAFVNLKPVLDGRE